MNMFKKQYLDVPTLQLEKFFFILRYSMDFAEKISCVARASLPIDGHSGLFQFQDINEAVVHKQLLGLKATKSIGLDNISARLLKCSAQSITYSITKLINLYIRTGKFQDIRKFAKVTALLKSGDRTNQTNHHPISILPTLSKILESVIHCQLYEYLDSNNLLSNVQFWFSFLTFHGHCIVWLCR